MSATAEFAYVWEYLVRADEVEEFMSLYGPAGDWVRLFSRSPDYVRTELYRDVSNPRRFVTTDFWRSKAARDRFREKVEAEFQSIDERGAALTEAERFVGDFEILTK